MVSLINVVLCAVFVHLPAVISFAAQGTDSFVTVESELPSTEFNLLLSSLKMVVALVLTLAILVAAVWVLKRILRIKRIPGFSGAALTVLEIRYIAPKKAVALVKVLQRVLIVGVSDQSLTTLGELTPEEIENLETDKKPESGVFKNILAGFTGSKKSVAR